METQTPKSKVRPRTSRPRRVLMVACAFPPTGGSGVQRSAKFAKYLPQFGWHPIVWTSDTPEGFPCDATLLSDLPPEVTVHTFECSSYVSRLRRGLARTTRRGGVGATISAGLDRQLRRFTVRTQLPDQFASWAHASIEPLTRLIHEEKVDAIYSTFSPPSNHLLALALKERTELPWVADFRDLWTDDYRYCESSTKRRQADRMLENRILRAADVVVAVTRRQTEILADHVPQQRAKFVTITNGFDPETPAQTWRQQRENGSRFVLAHVGRFDKWRARSEWFVGLKEFASRLGNDRSSFMLRIVGHAAQQTRELARASGVQCVFTGYVSHAEAVNEMRAADALLLNVPLGPNAESVIPAKLFEYLAAQRPILVVGPPGGECVEIVQSHKAGLSVEFDGHAIHDALGKLYDMWKAGSPMPGCCQDRLSSYSRVTLTGKLATVLDGLTGHTPEESGVAGPFERAVAL